MFLSFPSLKKSVSVVVTLTLLATFFLPIASHAESVEVQQEIIYPEGYNEKVAEWKGSTPIIKEGDTNGITPHGKIGVTLKALKAALEKFGIRFQIG